MSDSDNQYKMSASKFSSFKTVSHFCSNGYIFVKNLRIRRILEF